MKAAPPLVLTANNGVCGERLALTAEGQVVTGKTAVTVPDPSLSGQLLFVDANSGRVRRQIETPAEVIDVLALISP